MAKIIFLKKSYVLKISRPDVALDYLTFQDELFKHLDKHAVNFKYPKSFRKKATTSDGDGDASIGIFDFIDSYGNMRKIRLLEWIDGKLYSCVKPKSQKLRFSLGQRAGEITRCLNEFEHPLAHRTFDWNLSDVLWVESYLHLFTDKQLEIVKFYVDKVRKYFKRFFFKLNIYSLFNLINTTAICV
jgi:Ser/Thr protein kinase RdoA (MazF antagonist)